MHVRQVLYQLSYTFSQRRVNYEINTSAFISQSGRESPALEADLVRLHKQPPEIKIQLKPTCGKTCEQRSQAHPFSPFSQGSQHCRNSPRAGSQSRQHLKYSFSHSRDSQELRPNVPMGQQPQHRARHSWPLQKRKH